MDIVKFIEEEEPEGIGSDFIYTHGKIAIPYLTMICLATCFGTVGNVFIIGAVSADKRLRTIGNIFIVNLALADLFVSSFVNPFSILGIIEGEEWFLRHDGVCQAVASICLTSCFCSLLSIGTISFNRYIFICHNAMYEKIFTFKSSLVMVVLLWVVSFILEMPNFIGWGDHSYDQKSRSCLWDRTADLSYKLFFSICGVAFPVCLISICYFKIYRFVLQSKTKVATISNTQNNHVGQTKRLIRTIFIIFVIFTLCWAPYAVFVSADYKDQLPLEVHIFALLLAHTNSSLNCFIYGVTNRDFRKGYIRFIRLTTCGAVTLEMLEHCFRCHETPGDVGRGTSTIRSQNAILSTKDTPGKNCNIDNALSGTDKKKCFGNHSCYYNVL